MEQLTTTTIESREHRIQALDREGIRELFTAAREYHSRHSKGSGGASMCVCGAACGGSKACHGLAMLRDLFRYADVSNDEWKNRFEFVRDCFDK